MMPEQLERASCMISLEAVMSMQADVYRQVPYRLNEQQPYRIPNQRHDS